MKKCLGCRKDIPNTRAKHAKYCSRKCGSRNSKYARRHINPLAALGIPTNTIGAIAELRVAVDLMSKGYNVFRALSPACYCDLIATKGGKVYELEVRTAHLYRRAKDNALVHYKSSACYNIRVPNIAFVWADRIEYSGMIDDMPIYQDEASSDSDLGQGCDEIDDDFEPAGGDDED